MTGRGQAVSVGALLRSCPFRRGQNAWDDAHLNERLRSDLVLDVPRGQSAALYAWLRCAAVEAELGREGVIVRANANRLFRRGDLTAVVREWMDAHRVDAVLATYDCSPFVIAIERPERPPAED